MGYPDFTHEEIAELQRLVRRCFKGRPEPGDDDRTTELWNKNPDEYRKLAEQVRKDVRQSMRVFF